MLLIIAVFVVLNLNTPNQHSTTGDVLSALSSLWTTACYIFNCDFPLNMQIINGDNKLCNKLTKSYHIHHINCIFNWRRPHESADTSSDTDRICISVHLRQQWIQIRQSVKPICISWCISSLCQHNKVKLYIKRKKVILLPLYTFFLQYPSNYTCSLIPVFPSTLKVLLFDPVYV